MRKRYGSSSKVKAMTTDQLISLLVADLKPVDRRRILRSVVIALAIGTAAAFGVMLLIFGPRPEALDARNLDFLLIKLLFALGVVVTAAIFLPQLARPDAQMRSPAALIFVPFAAIAIAAAVALGSAQSCHSRLSSGHYAQERRRIERAPAKSPVL